jgi:ABC-type Fe3+/spermidine/putrescine transport system ATPase subunit
LGEANFIPGTIAGAPGPGGRVSVQTAIGTLQSGNALAGVAGGGVVVSIRPEAFRLSAGGGTPGGVNQVRGEVVEGTYLGEIAQYAVRVGDGSMLKVAHLNPGMVGLSARSQVALEVDAEDVVLLPGG